MIGAAVQRILALIGNHLNAYHTMNQQVNDLT